MRDESELRELAREVGGTIIRFMEDFLLFIPVIGDEDVRLGMATLENMSSMMVRLQIKIPHDQEVKVATLAKKISEALTESRNDPKYVEAFGKTRLREFIPNN